MELVSREAVLAKFDQYEKKVYEKSWVEALVRSVPCSDKWIPVGEALPVEGRMVLVSTRTKSGLNGVNRAYYSGGFWHGSGSMSGVTAWQELPEPYEGE